MLLMADSGAALFAVTLCLPGHLFLPEDSQNIGKADGLVPLLSGKSSPAKNMVDVDHVQTRDLSRTCTARVFTESLCPFFN